MKKIIYNVDNFIINIFKKISKLVNSDRFLFTFIGLLLIIIVTIIFSIPIIILDLIYQFFIDRDKLIKQYEKEKKKE